MVDFRAARRTRMLAAKLTLDAHRIRLMNSSEHPRRLRSRAWFDDADNADMTALYLERYMNFGLTLHELQSGRPIVGIAQTGSDLSPCNRHHLVLATRV